MASGKQSPRQKMIGMMYLVLTALLALNVTKEIINSFMVIEEGLNSTTKGIDIKNQVLYNQFQLAMLNDEKKTAPLYDKAMAVQKKSKELSDYIQNIKAEMRARCEFNEHDPSPEEIKKGDTFHSILLKQPDNYDIPTHFMIGEDPANVTGKAKDLEAKIDEFHKFLTDQLAPDQ